MPVDGVTRPGTTATGASIYSTGPGTGHTGAMTTGQKISSLIPGTEANWQKKVHCLPALGVLLRVNDI